MANRQRKRAEFRSAVTSRDPFVVASVFSLPPIASRPRGGEDPPSRALGKQPESLQENGLDWSPVLTAWLDACDAAEAGYAAKCYDHQAALHTAFNHVFAASPGSTLVPALQAVCKSTHRAALAADREEKSLENKRLQNAVTLLQESFSRTFNDRKELRPGFAYDEEGSKKAGVLAIVNELFAIYFRLNTLRLCKNLVRPVETRKLHEQGTMGQMVTYRYFTGRLALFEDQFALAEENLEFAFQNCHKDANKNMELILHYLIPVKLYRGRYPSPDLLKKYNLQEYVSLVNGVRKGDLRTFSQNLVEYQHLFIRQGTYLLLERCKAVCYRNLFMRIHFVLDKVQISLSLIAQVFKWLGMPIDLDEVECILANLIYRGYIRGYLSHTKRVLVLSKRDPFPLSSIVPK